MTCLTTQYWSSNQSERRLGSSYREKLQLNFLPLLDADYYELLIVYKAASSPVAILYRWAYFALEEVRDCYSKKYT